MGSGKTTIVNEFPNHVRISRDVIGGRLQDLLPHVETALKNGKDIVMDNTFMTDESRKPFIDLAKEYKVDIRCIELLTSLEDAQYNVVQRMIKLRGSLLSPEEINKDNHPNIMPPAVQFHYRKNYKAPCEEEGFSSIEKRAFARSYSSEYKNKALILDYDGTLRECINGNGKYPLSIDQIEINPKAQSVLERYKKDGWLMLGISNQSGISKGLLSNETAIELFEHTNKLLGVDIEYAFCPHQSAPLICYCRKPGCGFGVYFIEKYKLNPAKCYFVGDMKTDETFSRRCGFQFIHANVFFKMDK